MLYIFAIIKRKHFEVIMFVCFSHDTKHVHFEVIYFYIIAKIYTFSDISLIPLYYIMSNLHIKEIEIYQKQSKGIKN